MCDTIVKENLPKEEIPQYVYKRVQKVGNGKYITPVMGETLYKGSWKGAKAYPAPSDDDSYKSLVKLLQGILKFETIYFASSSKWDGNHVNMWGSFKNLKDASWASLNSNFKDGPNGKIFPTIIVKCEIRGIVNSSTYTRFPTYLSSQIRVVEELDKVPVYH